MKKKFLSTLVVLLLSFVLCACSDTATEATVQAPTPKPTAVPTPVPTAVPTAEPTAVPTAEPTAVPTAEPTAVPTPVPTAVPTPVPTAEPTAVPTPVPTPVPTAVPTPAPTAEPTPTPTAEPTPEPPASSEGNSAGGDNSTTSGGWSDLYPIGEWIDMGDWFLYISPSKTPPGGNTISETFRETRKVLQDRYPDQEICSYMANAMKDSECWAWYTFVKPGSQSLLDFLKLYAKI